MLNRTAEQPVSPDSSELDGESIKTLADAARVFFSRRGPRMMARQAAMGWGIRAFLGPPSITELPIVAGVVIWWPFQEWLAHKHLLHAEPRTIWGRRIDPEFARAHRAHHRNPRDVDGTLLPIEVVRTAIPINIAVWTVLGMGSPRRTATGIAAYSTMALVYEWIHFLVHTGVKPKSNFMKRVRRNHRMHHFRNEDYWFAFTWPDVDKWLGTEPDPHTVPRSETVMKLHHLDD